MHPEDRAQLMALLPETACVSCEKQMFFSEDQPTQEGQVYSDVGLKETRITELCEHCFDNITMPDEDEDGDS